MQQQKSKLHGDEAVLAAGHFVSKMQLNFDKFDKQPYTKVYLIIKKDVIVKETTGMN